MYRFSVKVRNSPWTPQLMVIIRGCNTPTFNQSITLNGTFLYYLDKINRDWKKWKHFCFYLSWIFAKNHNNPILLKVRFANQAIILRRPQTVASLLACYLKNKTENPFQLQCICWRIFCTKLVGMPINFIFIYRIV